MEFYHGTDKKGLDNIIFFKKIGVEYFDGIGFYLSDRIEVSILHGPYILVFTNIKKDNLIQDDVNDGYYHNGYKEIDSSVSIRVDISDRRVVRDVLEGIMEKIE